MFVFDGVLFSIICKIFIMFELNVGYFKDYGIEVENIVVLVGLIL